MISNEIWAQRIEWSSMEINNMRTPIQTLPALSQANFNSDFFSSSLPIVCMKWSNLTSPTPIYMLQSRMSCTYTWRLPRRRRNRKARQSSLWNKTRSKTILWLLSWNVDQNWNETMHTWTLPVPVQPVKGWRMLPPSICRWLFNRRDKRSDKTVTTQVE